MFQKREQTISYFNASLQVVGVAPRCRKSDYHTKYIEREVPVNYTEEHLSNLKTQANEMLKKYKNVKSAKLKLTFVQSDTVGIETIMLFSCPHTKEFNLLTQ